MGRVKQPVERIAQRTVGAEIDGAGQGGHGRAAQSIDAEAGIVVAQIDQQVVLPVVEERGGKLERDPAGGDDRGRRLEVRLPAGEFPEGRRVAGARRVAQADGPIAQSLGRRGGNIQREAEDASGRPEFVGEVNGLHARIVEGRVEGKIPSRGVGADGVGARLAQGEQRHGFVEARRHRAVAVARGDGHGQHGSGVLGRGERLDGEAVHGREVVVENGADGLGAREDGVAGGGQIQEERLGRFGNGVAKHRHVHRLVGHAGREEELPITVLIIQPGQGRAAGGGVADADNFPARGREAHVENHIGRTRVTLGHGRISDGKTGRPVIVSDGAGAGAFDEVRVGRAGQAEEKCLVRLAQEIPVDQHRDGPISHAGIKDQHARDRLIINPARGRAVARAVVHAGRERARGGEAHAEGHGHGAGVRLRVGQIKNGDKRIVRRCHRGRGVVGRVTVRSGAREAGKIRHHTAAERGGHDGDGGVGVRGEQSEGARHHAVREGASALRGEGRDEGAVCGKHIREREAAGCVRAGVGDGELAGDGVAHEDRVRGGGVEREIVPRQDVERIAQSPEALGIGDADLHAGGHLQHGNQAGADAADEGVQRRGRGGESDEVGEGHGQSEVVRAYVARRVGPITAVVLIPSADPLVGERTVEQCGQRRTAPMRGRHAGRLGDERGLGPGGADEVHDAAQAVEQEHGDGVVVHVVIPSGAGGRSEGGINAGKKYGREIPQLKHVVRLGHAG